MKNKIYIILLMFVLQISSMNAQNGLSVDLYHATIESQCEDGFIDLHISGGIEPYEVEWTGPANYSYSVSGISGQDDGEDIDNLRPGTYTVVVTDALCGKLTLSADIECEECSPTILGIAHHGFIECEPKKGKLTVVMTDEALPPFEIEWSNGETTETIDNLDPGYYHVTVTDSRDCETDFGINLVVKNPPIELDDSDFTIEENCLSSPPNGSISFINSLGQNLDFSWTGPNGFTSNSENLSDIASGEYCVEVRTAGNPDCIFARGCVTVGANTGPEVTLVDLRNESFCSSQEGSCNGFIEIEVPNGATIQWNTSNIPNQSQQNSKKVTNLCAGIYPVEVCLDGCCTTMAWSVDCCFYFDPDDPNETQVPPLQVKGEANSQNGSITLQVSGGGNNIYYQWTGPNGFTSTSKDISNLEVGEYCVRVFDGCSEFKDCFLIVNCDEVEINISADIENTCPDFNAGSISLTVSGGNSPYSFVWSNNQKSSSISNLGTGQFCVTVSDDSGCEETDCFTISNKSPEIIDQFCARTTICNDQFTVEEFPVIQSLDCNTLTQECTLTGQVLQFEFDFVSAFISNCALFGVCQDGQTVFIEQGFPEFGPFAIDRPGCPLNIGCVDQICCFSNGQCFISDDSNVSCSSAFFDNIFDDCPDPACFVQVFCSSTLVAEGCVESSECGFGITDGKDGENGISILDQLGIPDYADIKQGLLASANEIYFAKKKKGLNNEKDVEARETFALSTSKVYPNPFTNNINLEFEVSKNTGLRIKMFNAIGSEVYDESISINPDNQIFTIPDLSLQDGLYFIQIFENEKLVQSHKVIKN